MKNIVSSEQYLKRLISSDRPGTEQILSFYEHRLGVICKDPRLLLIPFDDHLVQRGDGIFETLKFVDYKIYLLNEHLERMKRSCSKIFLDPPCDWDEIKEIVKDVVKASEKKNGLVSIFIGRGCGGFSIDFRECKVSSLYIVCRKLPQYPKTLWEHGVTACKVSIPAKQNYLSQIKSVNYLPNVLMKREAIIKGFDYPVCFTEDGLLAEGATENICIVKNRKILIPELSHILPGTTLLRGIQLIDIKAEFQPLKEKDLFEADELILMGTTIDALGVVKYNEHIIGSGIPGEIAKTLREKLIEDQFKNGISVLN